MKQIYIIILLLIPFLLVGQNQLSKFKHLTLKDGLSQTTITCILKDSRGFMWFGTEDGLNKYDGTNFTIYRHQPDDDESLSSSYINTIIEEEDGFLWIGTKNGLNYFNPNTEKFYRYQHDPIDHKSLSHNEVNSLLISHGGRLLVGTSNGLNLLDSNAGFLKYSREEHEGTHYVTSMTQDKEGFLWVLSSELLEKIKLGKGSFLSSVFQKSVKSSIHNTMFLDSSHLWIGTLSGLVKFNLQTQTSSTSMFYGLNGPQDLRNSILSVINAQHGKLWLGTNGGGLILYDKGTDNFEIILHDPYDRLSLNSNAIRSSFLDEAGILWLGTFGGGINKHDPRQFKFEHYKYRPEGKNSISENSVRSILSDSDGELWVGTHGGLNRINRKTSQVKVYKYDQNDLSTISSNVVRALLEDSKGRIWAGTWENGLNRFDKQTGAFKRYISLPGRTNSIGPVRALEIDDHDNIWIGGNGLLRLNSVTNQYRSYFHDEKNHGVRDYTIHSLYLDKNERLWVGTYQNGLTRLDTSSDSIERYFHNPKDTLSISNNYVTSIAEDKNGSIWVGTYGGGLNILNIPNGTFRHYNTSNGLMNDVIYGILIDNQGFIWFTSNAGLGRFDPNTEEFKYYGVDQGIQSEEFNSGAYSKSKGEEFFFGGINGFNTFFPRTVYHNKKTYKIVFTDFQLHDEKNTFKTDKLLDKHISRAKQVRLNYDQNTFSLKFAELNYSDNVDNKYEYLLEGFEMNWQNLEKKRLITIGNLDPGDYTLHARVHNDLTKMTSLNITVSPPFWRSNWAYIAYVLVIILTTTLVYKNIAKTKRVRRQFELKIRNWENDTNANAQLQNQNDTGTTLSLKKVTITSANQKFLERAIKIVEDYIEDTDFDVEKFAGEMYLSRSQLHRKLKTLTGYSATKFIRLIRLKRAAQLLIGNTGTVSEIAYKVGFDNIGYFSKCFRETFGKPPSQYNIN